MKQPFVLSFLLHLVFLSTLLIVGGRSRPHAMTVPVQTVRWVNIVPPTAPSVAMPQPVKPKPVAPNPKSKPASATAIVPQDSPKDSETPPPPPLANASPAPRPETTAEPNDLAETVAGGLPGATGMKVDDPDFTFIYYLNIIRNRIQDHWNPPRLSSSQTQNRQTMVMFRITRSGKITDIRVEQSSGYFMFDQAAQRALYETAKLPPLPDEYGGQELTVHIEFETLR